MKRLFFILFASVITWQTGSAQSGSDTYLTCNSLSKSNITEGIGRYEDSRDDKNPLYNYRAVMFLMNSDSKDICIWFLHSNLNLTELRKIREPKWYDQLKIIYKPRTFLGTIERAKPIHLEEKLKSFRNNKEAWMWANNLKGKVLYMKNKIKTAEMHRHSGCFYYFYNYRTTTQNRHYGNIIEKNHLFNTVLFFISKYHSPNKIRHISHLQLF